jgi:hypothetical protein
MFAVQIHHDKIVGRHHAFVQASGSGEDAIGVEAHGEIALLGNDVASLVQPAADLANVITMLLLSLRRARGR